MWFLFGRSIPKDLSQHFASRAAQDGHKVIFASMGNFLSGEGFCELRGFDAAELKGQPVVVLQSLAQTENFSANDFFTQTLWAGDTLKRYGAGPLWAVTPFGPYARQDMERTGKMDSVACEAAARHLALDFNGLSAVELHSTKGKALLETHLGAGHVFSLDPTGLFVQDLQNFTLKNPVVVSPDKGANARADALAQALNADRFYIDKERSEVINTKIIGSQGDVENRDAIMVDDMADTFGTAAGGIKLLREKKASRVFFYSAHPVLSGPAWDNLAKLLSTGALDQARFGNTIARSAALESFAQQHGPEMARKIGFINTADLLYDHLTTTIAQHPAMQSGGPV
ncbi:MAG: ribose-phosphate diphosphokinase [Alphaproteobacteria bacterium]|nr:ribose-phosphate diphosphokinase [Alphaproteobacteria bacterium]